MHEQMVTANGVSLWTLRHGAGAPLVLLHGGPGMWDEFGPLAAEIDDLVEVHRYDQRGGGRSERRGPYTVETFVADLEALRAHWGHESWIVGGHSAGANLALAYTLAFPQRVDAVLYLGGTGVIDDWHDEYHANADARRTPDQRRRYSELRALRDSAGCPAALDREYCLLTWLPDFADPVRGRALLQPTLDAFTPSYEVNAAMNADWKRLIVGGTFAVRVASIGAPVLVLQGEADPRPVRLAERLAASLPHAELAVVPRAGHSPWLERPEPTRDVIRQFLTQATPRAT